MKQDAQCLGKILIVKNHVYGFALKGTLMYPIYHQVQINLFVQTVQTLI